jgi:hypothetical protein
MPIYQVAFSGGIFIGTVSRSTQKKTQSDEVNLFCSKNVMNYGGITVNMVTNTLRDTGQIA